MLLVNTSGLGPKGKHIICGKTPGGYMDVLLPFMYAWSLQGLKQDLSCLRNIAAGLLCIH